MNFLSMCSGIEAASQAWGPLGWNAVAFSEIDPFACDLLATHYPDVPNWGDMTKYEEWPDANVDVLCGGTPCQSFSIAGLRAGLADPRGNLMLTFGAIAAKYRPRWLVWENVPGVLSSDAGRDFAAFLGLLTGQLVEPPAAGWSTSGVLSGIDSAYGIAWRVLDAQYAGVPQRRRRVFVVGHLGDWRRAAAVLFERHSLSGNPAPSRKARQDVAGTLSARTEGGGGLGTDFELAGGIDNASGPHAAIRASAGRRGGIQDETGPGLIALDVVGSLTASSGPRAHGGSGLATNGGAEAGHLIAYGGNNTSGPIEVAAALRPKGGTGHGDFESETFIATDSFAFKASHYTRGKDGAPSEVAPPLTADADKGDQDTLIAFGFAQNQRDEVRVMDVAGALAAETGAKQQTYVATPAIAFDCKASGQNGFGVGEIAGTQRAIGHKDSHTNGGGHQAVAYSTKLHNTTSNQSGKLYREYTASLDHNSPPPALLTTMQVRRLTPLECERLQGMRDGYTAITRNGKPAADGPRYKSLGNSWAIPDVRWIGERIELVDAIK